MARMLAEAMSSDLGVPIVIENVPGAGGVIGANLVARSRPDGYKMLFTNSGFIVAPLTLRNVGYDPISQFLGVRQIATVPLVLVVRSSSPYRTLADMAVDVRRGERISYASLGVGTPSHLAGESINRYMDAQFTHIPYGGNSKAYSDIQSGAVTFGIVDASFAIPFIRKGMLRAVAVTGRKRLDSLPNTPTLIEVGVPFTLVGWYGVFLPTGVNIEALKKIRFAFDSALAKPAIKEYIDTSGLGYIDPVPTSLQWESQYQNEMREWNNLAKILNISIK